MLNREQKRGLSPQPHVTGLGTLVSILWPCREWAFWNRNIQPLTHHWVPEQALCTCEGGREGGREGRGRREGGMNEVVSLPPSWGRRPEEH